MSTTIALTSSGKGFTWATERVLPPFIVGAAVLYNFVFCFVDTKLFETSARMVISCEIAVVGMAFTTTWYRSRTFYVIILLLAGYFYAVMLARAEFDPKVMRDVLIPFAFFFMGSYLGTLRSADKLVTILIVVASGAAVFEWLALNTYLHYFDVIRYYVARGTETALGTDSANGVFIRSGDSYAGLYINGTRFQARTLLPFLGDHRVSGIFLEPVSVGNFGAMAFAWISLRDRDRFWPFVAKTFAVAAILVLADARYGLYLSVLVPVIYLAAPLVRPTMLFMAPFFVMLALTTYAGLGWRGSVDNTLAGRSLGAGHSLATLDALQVFGLQKSDFFVSGYAGDSGYGYALVNIGLVGLAALWALFAFARVPDREAWLFKNFVAVYAVSLLAISASLFSIKTAALVWFLYGTLNNPNRADSREFSAGSVRRVLPPQIVDGQEREPGWGYRHVFAL